MMGIVNSPEPGLPATLDGFDRSVGPEADRFRSFVVEAEPRLRRAFVSAYGGERGREATAEALAYAWEYWPEVQAMDNATRYLYRVGQSRTKQRKTPASFAAVVEDSEHLIEPELEAALSELSDRQRTAVLLVFAYGWTLREAAEHRTQGHHDPEPHGERPCQTPEHDRRGRKRLTFKNGFATSWITLLRPLRRRSPSGSAGCNPLHPARSRSWQLEDGHHRQLSRGRRIVAPILASSYDRVYRRWRRGTSFAPANAVLTGTARVANKRNHLFQGPVSGSTQERSRASSP